MPGPSDGSGGKGAAPRWMVLAAFAAVYLIWGSTYLAIRVSIETIPPLLMGGFRYLLAGGLLYGFLRAHGEPAPTRAHWKLGALLGGLMFLAGNGGVNVAEQWVPSGLVALLVAMVPMWVALLEWAGGLRRPKAVTVLGLVLGLGGVAMLTGGLAEVAGPMAPVAVGVLLVGTFCWSLGTLRNRRGGMPSSPLMAVALQMTMGGVLLTLAGTAVGEWGRFEPAAVTARSLVALAYLVVLGSWVAFTAYVWLVRVVPASRVATYAFVNPVVAVLLGAAVASEPLTPATTLAGAVIVAAVALLTLTGGDTPVRERVSTLRAAAARLAAGPRPP